VLLINYYDSIEIVLPQIYDLWSYYRLARRGREHNAAIHHFRQFDIKTIGKIRKKQFREYTAILIF